MSTPPTDVQKPSFRDRLKLLLEEYGKLALAVFIVLWILSAVGLWTAVSLGWSPTPPDGGQSRVVAWLWETAPTLAVTYLMMRVTMPLRVIGTLVLTPLVAKVAERFGWRRPVARAPAQES